MRSRRPSQLVLCAFLATAAQVSAARPPPMPASTQNDVECLVAIMSTVGLLDKIHPGSSQVAMMYYFGKVDGDVPQIDLEAAIRWQLSKMTKRDISAADARCGKKLIDRGRAMVAIGKSIQSNPPPILPTGAPGAARKINTAEIDEILRAAVETQVPGALKLRGFGLEPPYHLPDKYYPRFLIYQATWDNVGGSVNLGFYALDPLTLDVWNGVMCEEIKSPKLASLQRKFRARIGLSGAEYRRLRVNGPEC
jgi:hypothetical protein